MDVISDKQILQYVLTDKIGEGRTGAVYKAWDTTMERMVAIRWLRPDLLSDKAFRARCLSMLRAMSDLVHPNIVTVYGASRVDDNLLIIMEYVSGRSLVERMREGSFGNTSFLEFAIQTARGLTLAHEWNVVHGTIRPSNIIITDNNIVKLMDFGLVYDSSDEESDAPRLVDELRYHAPEQIAEGKNTLSSDLYSLGAVYWECLTGKPVFAGHTKDDIENAVLGKHLDFTILRSQYDLPGETVLVLKKLLTKDPSDRFQTAGELLVTLEAMKSFEKEQKSRTFLQVKPDTPRQYALLSILALLLIILWLVITTVY